MEDTTELTIENFVMAVNKKIDKDPNFKENLNTAVTGALPKDNTFFKSLDEFANFLPKTIKEHLNKTEIKGKLEEDWKKFEIQDQDLEELYKINLNLDTKKMMMIATLDIWKSERKKLSTDQEIKQAFEIFKKILGSDKVSVRGFGDFINNNFKSESIPSKNMNDIIDYVALKNEGDKLGNWAFWNVCLTLKEQPSQKFINFMVKNTDFTSMNSDQLISSIIILMPKHTEYLKSPSKGNIFTALENILGGKEPYQEFSKALLGVPNIEETLKWETIISSDDDEIQYFAYILASNGIKIELNSAGETSKFTVKEEDLFKEFENVEEAKLIKLLAKEPELNQWIKDVFTIDMEYVTAGFVKDCSLIGKIDSMEALASAKATAIQSFIEQSKDKDRLKKMYGKLLGEKRTELLSSVTLDNETAEWALSALHNFFSKDKIIQFDNDDGNGSIAQLKKFIENWKKQVTGSDNPVSVRANLGSFIWRFQGKFSRDDFDKLLNLNIWELSENTLYGYALSNILYKVKDGCISDNFLKMIKNQRSVDFSDLWSDNDRYFGRCLFSTIYELIRTSENYDSKDPEKQKQAIWDVLEKGEKYQWFREGLKTFFQKAKDGKNRTAKDINMKDILKEIPDLAKLLQNCKLELKFDSGKRELTFEEIPEIKMNVKQGEQPQEEQPKEEENKKEEQAKENPLENLEEKKLSIEGKIIGINIEKEPKGQINQINQTENGQKLITDTNKGTTQNEKVGNTVIGKYKVERPKEEEIIGGNENDKTKKSKFPTWAKYLIGFGIAAVAVLALLFGFGVLGALAGTAKTVALVVAVLAIFAELIYLAVLYVMSQDNNNPDGGRGSGDNLNSIEFDNNMSKNRSIVTELGKGQKLEEVPITDPGIGMTEKDKNG